MNSEAVTLSISQIVKSRIKDYAALGKLRLSSLVVFSAVIGYFIAAENFSLFKLLGLAVGGFLVTAASNGFNQILEKDTDGLMQRTKDRPLVKASLSALEAYIFSVIAGSIGIAALWFLCNPLSAILGMLALFIYAGVYTPLKRVSPLAVFVGAFPGAVPPMLGYIAETGQFGLEPGLLFATQFMWQFPHFWAIAWKLDEDYKRGGFYLLPFRTGKTKASAFQILLYTTFLLPVSIAPYFFGLLSLWGLCIILLAGLVFWFASVKLYTQLSDNWATKLMLLSFVYLPIVQIILLIGKP